MILWQVTLTVAAGDEGGGGLCLPLHLNPVTFISLPGLFTTQKQKQMTHSDCKFFSPYHYHFIFLLFPVSLHLSFLLFSISCSRTVSHFQPPPRVQKKKKKSLEFVMCRSKLPPLFSLSFSPPSGCLLLVPPPTYLSLFCVSVPPVLSSFLFHILHRFLSHVWRNL